MIFLLRSPIILDRYRTYRFRTSDNVFILGRTGNMADLRSYRSWSLSDVAAMSPPIIIGLVKLSLSTKVYGINGQMQAKTFFIFRLHC